MATTSPWFVTSNLSPAWTARRILLLSLRIPLSGYTAAHGKDDSPTLTAMLRLEQLVTTGNGSLTVALITTMLALAGAAALFRPRFGAAVALTLATVAGAALSLGAHSFDARNAQRLRTHDMPADARWVDHAKLGRVALIEAPGSIAPHAIEALWWNTSIDREFLLGTGIARALLDPAPPDQRALAIDAVRDALAQHYEDGRGVRLGAGAWLVTTRA
jgi:hypothetical protein